MKYTKRVLIIMIALLSVNIGLAGSADYYKVEVTREGQDLYKVTGKDIYIRTRYCYEYVYYDESILKIDSVGGFNIGKITFSNGNSCDVQKLLRE